MQKNLYDLCEWNARPKQEIGWEGREVKGEVENENGNQTQPPIGFHVWVATCS